MILLLPKEQITFQHSKGSYLNTFKPLITEAFDELSHFKYIKGSKESWESH